MNGVKLRRWLSGTLIGIGIASGSYGEIHSNNDEKRYANMERVTTMVKAR